MLFTMAWREWNVIGRLKALQSLNLFYEYNNEHGSVDIRSTPFVDSLSGGQLEAAKFIADPTFAPRMWIFDSQYSKVINRLHHEFWCWRNKQVYFDIESEIAKAIKLHISELPCKEQDEYLHKTPQQILQDQEAVKQLINNMLSNEYINWNRISSLIFA